MSSPYLALTSFAFLLALGQILFKYAADTSPRVASIGGVIGLVGNPYLWAAGLLYVAATLLWLMILQHVPLSRAYVFAALGFVIVPMASSVLFGDSLSLRFVVGTVLIVAGVYLAGTASVR